MISDVSIGALLSGGIDSSSIVAMMRKNTDDKIRTYTLGFENGIKNEFGPAKLISEKFNTDHLSPLIMNHSKFGDLQTGIYTGKGGCLAVNGWVKTEKDLEELKSLVNTINPPLSVHWTIKIEDILLKDLIENEDK